MTNKIGSIKLIYLTIYNHFIYKYDYDKNTIQNTKFNLAASSTNLVLSTFTTFLAAFIYQAISGAKFPKSIPLVAWLPVVIGYFLLYQYFQKHNDLNELYDNYLSLSSHNLKKWKIITILYFVFCILSGFLPLLRKS